MPRTVNPPELSDPRPHHFSHAVVADGRLAVSGQVAVDGDGNRVGDDVATQARLAFDNVAVVLDAVDLHFGDVTEVRSHVVDPRENYDAYLAEYRERFDAAPYPAHTALGARLPDTELLVEVEVAAPVGEEVSERGDTEGDGSRN